MKRKKLMTFIATAALAAVAISGVILLKGEKIKTISIDKAAEELKEYRFKTYSNLKFECAPKPLESDSLYVLKIKSPDDYENDDDRNWHIDYMANKEKELFEYEINKADIKSVIPSELEYYSQDEAHCALYPSHTFTFTDGKRFDPMLRESGDNNTDINTYTDLRDNESVKFDIKGKEIDLKKAAEYAEDAINKNLNDILNKEEKVKAADAICVKDENGISNYFVIRLQHTIEGVGVNENGYVAPYSSEGYIKPSYMLAYMTAENEIVSYVNNYYYKIVDKDKVSKIIPLSTATDILSNSLAKNLNYSVKAVELKYTTVVNGKYNKKKNDDIVEMRPMWSFILFYGPAHSSQFINTTTAYVDAVTGIVYYCSYDNFEESEPILN